MLRNRRDPSQQERRVALIAVPDIVSLGHYGIMKNRITTREFAMDEETGKEALGGIGRDSGGEVERFIPADILGLYDVYSYRHAAAILASSEKNELDEILQALRDFHLTEEMIKKGGGNQSDIPKEFSRLLRPGGWMETRIRGDLIVVQTTNHGSGKKTENRFKCEGFLDGHKVDYVKNRVAFDLEWNSKDQTFDRDLYAARAFYECGLISAGILVTRSETLNPVFAQLGNNVKKKYGASTTWIGKLLPRLDTGRNGGCPVLVFAITSKLIKSQGS